MIRTRDRRRNLTEESVSAESTHDTGSETREPVAFGGAGLLATIVYGLRRFRLDDYAGHYRLWLLVVPTLFLASVCAIVPLHEVWSLVCARLIGGKATDATTKLWWAAPAILAVV